MNMFKAALKAVCKHPVYFLIYCVWMSTMGIFIANGLSVDTQEAQQFEESQSKFAIIDRDHSEVSLALTEHLAQSGTRVDVDDSTFAMQDAVAKDEVYALVIVPEHFGEDFLAFAEGSASRQPQIQISRGSGASAAALVLQNAERYLQMLGAAKRLELAKSLEPAEGLGSAESLGLANGSELAEGSGSAKNLESAESLADIIANVDAASKEKAETEVLVTDASGSAVDRFAFYVEWSVYTLTTAVMVCVGVLVGAFNRVSIRQRNGASPVPNFKANVQLAIACLVVTLVAWGFSMTLGAVVFGWTLQELAPQNIVLIFAASFCFALFPLACAFLLGQLGVSESGTNAIANIVGLVLAFLGGAWISIDLMGEGMRAVAQFTPSYWLTETVNKLAHTSALDGGSTLEALGGIGMLLLFAAAMFSVAFAVGKARQRSSDAGGNDAATASAL